MLWRLIIFTRCIVEHASFSGQANNAGKIPSKLIYHVDHVANISVEIKTDFDHLEFNMM